MEKYSNRIYWMIGVITLGSFVLFGAATVFGKNVIPELSTNFSSSMKGDDNKSSEITFAKGGDISAWSTSPNEILADIDSMHLNSVSIPVRVNISDVNNSDASVDPSSMAYAQNIASIMEKKHINTIVEPYPYIKDGTRTEVELDPTNKHEFMVNWSNSVKTIAKAFSKNDNVKGLYIGSNLVHLENETDEFTTLIGDLRPIFKGDIIYRTNWWYNAVWDEPTTKAFETKKETPLFKKVDVLSIASYFEVTNTGEDIMSVPELKTALNSTTKYSRQQHIIDQIKALHEATGKPITFGELGITNFKGAMANPYKYDYQRTDPMDDNIQSVWYTAWIETMKQYDWFKGYYLFGVGDTNSIFAPNAKAQETVRNLK